MTCSQKDWCTMRSANATKVIAKCILKYYKISLCGVACRWEAPLFRLDPRSSNFSEAIQQVVSLACGSTARGSTEPQQQQTTQKARSLQPTVATTSQRLASTNLLHDFDKASQEVITGIMQSQAGSAAAPAGDAVDINLDRQVSMPELRRLKRDFMKLLTQLHTNRLQDVDTAKRMFIEYLQSHVH